MTGPHERIITGVPTVSVPGGARSLSEVGSDLDLEATLREMQLTMNAIRAEHQNGAAISSAESLEDDEFITSIAKEVSRKNLWGKIFMYLAGIVGTLFSLGMAYQLFIGANATDAEVKKEVKKAVVEHNGGRDPDALTHEGFPIGHHPEMKESIQQLTDDTKQVKVDVGVIKAAQKKAEKRGEYQYEFSRWQGKVMECERTRRCKAPKKPKHLDTLESDIHLGKFD